MAPEFTFVVYPHGFEHTKHWNTIQYNTIQLYCQVSIQLHEECFVVPSTQTSRQLSTESPYTGAIFNTSPLSSSSSLWYSRPFEHKMCSLSTLALLPCLSTMFRSSCSVCMPGLEHKINSLWRPFWCFHFSVCFVRNCNLSGLLWEFPCCIKCV